MDLEEGGREKFDVCILDRGETKLVVETGMQRDECMIFSRADDMEKVPESNRSDPMAFAFFIDGFDDLGPECRIINGIENGVSGYVEVLKVRELVACLAKEEVTAGLDHGERDTTVLSEEVVA